MRGSDKLRETLAAGEFEGVAFTARWSKPLEVGDTYLAARNTGPHLLTAKVVDRENGWVIPEENAYSFDIGECVPIELHI